MQVYTQKQGAWVEPGMMFRSRAMLQAFGLQPKDDRDPWDQEAWHIVAVAQDCVAGYYRAMTNSDRGFCTEIEFDLGPLGIDPSDILEVGRACADPAHPTALFGLWRAVIALAVQLDRRWIMGTASLAIKHYNINAISQQWRDRYGYLEQSHAVPRMTLPDCEQGSEKRPPSLIRTYQNLGARVVSDPGWDPRFQTADVVTMLDTHNMVASWRRKLGMI